MKNATMAQWTENNSGQILDEDGRRVCQYDIVSQEIYIDPVYRKKIINRVNSHDELLAVLKDVLESHENEIEHGGQVYTDADRLREAINNAEER